MNVIKIFCIVSGIVAGIGQTRAQKVISGTSERQFVKIQPHYVFTKPPRLEVKATLKDENGDGLLEAGEKAVLIFRIQNKGEGSAYGLKIQRIKGKNDSDILENKPVYISEIESRQEHSLQMPLHIGDSLSTRETTLQFTIKEYFGFDADTCVLKFQTLEHLSPLPVCAGIEISDEEAGNGTHLPDGILQPGEQADLKIRLTNLGGSLYNARYLLNTPDLNIRISQKEGNIGSFPIGNSVALLFNICCNNRFEADHLPLFLNLYEKDSLLTTLKIPVPLHRRPERYSVITLKPELENILRLKKASDRNDDLSKAAQIPVSRTVRRNALAIVIGVEDYRFLPPAPYAANDARLMTEYFKNTLGVKEVWTFYNQEVKGDFFENLFGSEGRLTRSVKSGLTDLFVYYSGHGIPEKDGKDAYLFPYDGRLSDLNQCGYSLNRFYKALDELKAASVTVFLDACFIGVTKASVRYIPQNISGTKGILVRPPSIQPWLNNPHFTVFASSHQDESSLAFDSSETGLFTYFLAIGLHGNADSNGDRKITLKELADYVSRKVVETSQKIRGEQTPQLNGNGERVLVEY